MNPKILIKTVMVLIATGSLVCCRKTGSTDSPASKGSADSTFVAPADVERRFPGAMDVLRRHSIPLVKLEVPEKPYHARFVVDLGANPRMKEWDPFVAFVLDLGESLKWRRDLDLEDRSKNVKLLLDWYAIESGQGGFILLDSLGFFASPKARIAEDPLEGLNKTPRDVGLTVEPDENPDAHVEFHCGGIMESGSTLFYSIKREEFAGEDEPSGASIHFGVGEDRYASAKDGKQWRYALAFGGLPMRGSGKNAQFLRWGASRSPKAWRLTGYQCDASPGLSLWRYRASDRRLVRISLENIAVINDISLDSTALEGDIEWIREAPGQKIRPYALTKSAQGLRVYSSSDSGLFDQVWLVPSNLEANASMGIRFAPLGAAPESVYVGDRGFRLEDIDWRPSSPKVPTQGS